MRSFLAALLLSATVSLPAHADEIEDILTGALEAYQAGDAKLAKEEVEYVLELLKDIEGDAMKALLPTPLDGWTMEMTDDAMGLSMFGGSGVSADYRNDAGDQFSVLIANSPQLVGTMGAMLANAATMSAMGEVVRINRERFVISDDQIQGLVDKRVLIQFEGRPVEAMRAHLETLDIDAIKDF